MPKSFAGSFGPQGNTLRCAFSTTIEVWCHHLGSGRAQVEYPSGRLEGQREMWSFVKMGVKKLLDKNELDGNDTRQVRDASKKLAKTWLCQAAARLKGKVTFLNMGK